jgi:4'-phosphopantetheinyl transferase
MFTIYCNNLYAVEWKKTDTCLFDVTNQVDVWKIDTTKFFYRLDYFFSLLHQNEKQKALAFKVEKDKNNFIIRKGLLKYLLAKYLKTNTASIEFTDGNNKKPILVNNNTGLHFNSSHSGNFILIAIAKQEVGVDIEHINTAFNYQEILSAIFSDAEINWILKNTKAVESFFQLFTRKEAIIKASSKGITDFIKNVPVLNGKHLIGEATDMNIRTNLLLNSFFVEEDFAASICFNSVVKQIQFYSLDNF